MLKGHCHVGTGYEAKKKKVANFLERNPLASLPSNRVRLQNSLITLPLGWRVRLFDRRKFSELVRNDEMYDQAKRRQLPPILRTAVGRRLSEPEILC